MRTHVTVIDTTGGEEGEEPEQIVLINPSVIAKEGKQTGEEGCLSIPGIRGHVPRHRRIRVRYRDLEGREVDREFVDFVARIVQHEHDHLDGVVFLDRLESTQDIITEREYQRRHVKFGS